MKTLSQFNESKSSNTKKDVAKIKRELSVYLVKAGTPADSIKRILDTVEKTMKSKEFNEAFLAKTKNSDNLANLMTKQSKWFKFEMNEEGGINVYSKTGKLKGNYPDWDEIFQNKI